MAADRIRLGEADVMIAGGTESMSMIPMGGNKIAFNEHIFDQRREHRHRLRHGHHRREGGAAVEGVARGAGSASRPRAIARRWRRSQRASSSDEITPYTIDEHVPDLAAQRSSIRRSTASADEGPRAGTTLEVLAKLRPAFAANGSVTAGNSSQTSDGAGAVILVSEAALKRFNLQPLARFLGFAVAGVPPEIMGIGPKFAIPKVLKQIGLKLDDLDWIELNEAFAAQSLAVIQRPRARSREDQSARRRDRARPSARRDRCDPHRDASCTACAAASRSTAWSRCASAPGWARPACSKRCASIRPNTGDCDRAKDGKLRGR